MHETQKKLLDDFQSDFPLTPRPFADIASRIGMSERGVIEAYEDLLTDNYISRIGAVVTPNRVGASTLAAMAIPRIRLEEVADIISAYDEVNHNYEREHLYNLWFVVAANDEMHLAAVLTDMEKRTGFPILVLPMLKDYHLDLGFKLEWS